MKYLFYLAHPAHFHLFKNTIQYFCKINYNSVKIIIKSKDVLSPLLEDANLNYINILPEGRKNSRFDILFGVVKRDFRLYKIVKEFKPDLIISSSAEFAPVARMINIPIINMLEDDLVLFKNYSRYFASFVDYLICPESCNNGSLNKKTIFYNGIQENAYLRPEYFTPDKKLVDGIFLKDSKNFIIRFSSLNAWHDKGKTGITFEFAKQIIDLLEEYGRVFITSEKPLTEEFEKYRIEVKASDMHSFLAFADLYVGDSQTMTAEAAILGTPAIRLNDFVRKLGYLEMLEYKYDLTYGFETKKQTEMINKLKELLEISDLKERWIKKSIRYFNDTIDVNKLFIDILEQYPEKCIELLNKKQS